MSLPAALRPKLFRPPWLSPRVFRTEALAGLVVALALIPEAVSFSIIAGVDPRVGLFASFTMAVVIAFAAGGIARLMRFLPRSVMVGFVNALAILIFLAQLPYLIDVPWTVYALLAAGLVIMVGLPRLTKAIPAPLVAIVVLTAFTIAAGVAVPTVGDEGELPSSLPILGIPPVPFSLETLSIVAPYALAMAVVGLMESLMTAKLVDGITDTHSNKTRESWGQGIANIVTGFFGGMGGCAMIGQTMINVKSGARTRLSTFLSGVFLLVLVVALGQVVAMVPMAALVGVIIMVSVATFDWHSCHPRTLRRMPKSETIVMVSTVMVTVLTHNLAIGVIAGVLVAMVLFARRVAHLVTVDGVLDPDGSTKIYRVTGQLFFASSNDMVFQFDYANDPASVIIDLSEAHIWDASTVASLDAITTKYESRGTAVTITGMNPASKQRHAALAGTMSGSH